MIARIGTSLLDSITFGLYTRPVMVIREFIQNSSDAIDEAVLLGLLSFDEHRIDIFIDGHSRKIEIIDNGLGVSYEEALNTLGSIGLSNKRNRIARGFRGIGRLGAIAYCDQLVFETKTDSDQVVTVVEWDGVILRKILLGQRADVGLQDIIGRVVSTKNRKLKPTEESRFFRVSMNNIHSFHSDELMHVSFLRDQLSQILPVPYDQENFSFSNDIDEFLTGFDLYNNYNIRINNMCLLKPYKDTVILARKGSDKIIDIKRFTFKNAHNEILAKGWHGITEFKGAIHQDSGIRGIRVRQGNIAIGNEGTLNFLFPDNRLAYWHIGEIHVSTRLRPNTRRDGFVQSDDLESFLEQSQNLALLVSNWCRSSSKIRSRRIQIQRSIERMEASFSVPIFLDEEDASKKLAVLGKNISRLERQMVQLNNPPELQNKVELLRNKLDAVHSNALYLNECLDGRCLRHITQKELVTGLYRTLLEGNSYNGFSEQLLLDLIAPYLKPSARFILE